MFDCFSDVGQLLPVRLRMGSTPCFTLRPEVTYVVPVDLQSRQPKPETASRRQVTLQISFKASARDPQTRILQKLMANAVAFLDL